MALKRFVEEQRQIILHTEGMICSTPHQLTESEELERIVALYIKKHVKQNSQLQAILDMEVFNKPGGITMTGLLRFLADHPLEEFVRSYPEAQPLLEPRTRNSLLIFVEELYDFWRTFDRFMVLHSEPGPSSFDQRPYRSFNATMESLTHLIRSVYRDVCENITGDHPRIYRQVAAGCNVGLIAVPQELPLPEPYAAILGDVPFIRQVLINPPMIIDPPMNTRTGQFQKDPAEPAQRHRA